MLFLWSPYFSIFVLFFHLKLIILTAVRPPHVFIIFETIFPSIWPASINILINLSKRWIILPKKIYCTGGAISPNVLKSPNLTYAISRFLAKIIPVPISPKVPNIAEFFGDLYLKLLFERHQWRHFQDWLSQISYFQFLFDCALKSIWFYAFWWFSSYESIVKLSYKI